jgi:hypothetical protein
MHRSGSFKLQSICPPNLKTDDEGKYTISHGWPLLTPFRTNRKMKFSLRVIAVCVGAIVLAISTVSSRAFALLGPVQPWMQATNGVALPGDTGGPMPIGCGYRWNVPVVTYGFDQSFLDYFGSNGVAAVEGAIQILNNLPPASQIVATNYPFFTEGENFQAQAESLLDLKSYTLSLLLEHFGTGNTDPLYLCFVSMEPGPDE